MLSQWDDTIGDSVSTLLFLHSSGRILGRWKLSFKLKDVDRAPFSDLWSRPGFSKLYKELFLAKFLISHMCEMETSLCEKYTPPHLLPSYVYNQVLEIELGVGKGT